LRSGEDAAARLAMIRAGVVARGLSHGTVERRSLRRDANVCARPVGRTTLGTKTEIKNINSFKFVQKALEFEIARQTAVVERGERVRQETRLWDTDRAETITMRSKEEAHDYRYFPEPDLAPLVVDAEWIAAIGAGMPELPEARERRFIASFGLGAYDADVLIRILEGGADYFEKTVDAGAPPKAASNWIQGEIRRKLKDIGAESVAAVPISPERLAGLIGLVERGVISSSAAKAVFETMWGTDLTAQQIVDAEGLAQSSDESEIARLVADVMGANPESVEQIRGGRNNVLGFLVGLVMKASGGKANPKVVTAVLKRAINGD